MLQSLAVFCVMESTDSPHAPLLSVAMTVTWPASVPVPVMVMRTPGIINPVFPNASSWRLPWVGSDRLHVAVLPSPVIAGMENVTMVSPGMNAEYIGEKMMGTVGFAQVPALVLIPPASVGTGAV